MEFSPVSPSDTARPSSGQHASGQHQQRQQQQQQAGHSEHQRLGSEERSAQPTMATTTTTTTMTMMTTTATMMTNPGRPALVGSLMTTATATATGTTPATAAHGQAGEDSSDEDSAYSPKSGWFTLRIDDVSPTQIHLPLIGRQHSEASSVSSRAATPLSSGPGWAGTEVAAAAASDLVPTAPVPALLSPRTGDPEQATLQYVDPAVPQSGVPERSWRLGLPASRSGRRGGGGGGGGRPSTPAALPSSPSAAATENTQAGADVEADGGGRDGSPSAEARPKRFTTTFPWVRSGRIRVHVIRLVTMTLFLLLVLAVYLGLTVSGKLKAGALPIILVLIILGSISIVLYSIIPLVLLLRKPLARADGQAMASLDPGGYLVLREPIQVELAQDVAIGAGSEGLASSLKPPAYGAWRESIRLDPDRLFWQQRTAAPAPARPGRIGSRPGRMSGAGGGAGLEPRPPSYVSDDGVSYVVEAVSRSTVALPGPGLPTAAPV